MPDINQVVRALEEPVRAFEWQGARVVELQIRPSGDDVDVIKVWVDLGETAVDPSGWARACEAAHATLATGFRLQVRAEKA
ncbi:MAG: hypothetical protein NT062_07450 [Proteobacteria bacterium]|nr:hypothetical protein [Pseudomonadota bacterium]